MRRHLVHFIVAGAISLVLASCDSYALLDQFQKPAAQPGGGLSFPLSLTLQETSVQQNATISLYPSGGTPPYSFGLVVGSLYDPGTTLGSISGQMYTAGDAIGTVTVHLSDASGAIADAAVTIIPPKPASFIVQPDTTTASPNDISVSWSYSNTALISGFMIERSTDGVTFSSQTSQPNSLTNYSDKPLNKNQRYYYRMYAVAGPYQSLPTSVLSATP